MHQYASYALHSPYRVRWSDRQLAGTRSMPICARPVHGLADYKRGLDDLDATTRSLVTGKLLPQQQQTHDRLSALKHRL